MTAKWIGEAARELGVSTLDAVEFLAARQEYPWDGLLDEERLQLLRLLRASRRGVEASGAGAAHHVAPPAPPSTQKPLSAPKPPAPKPPAPKPPPPRSLLQDKTEALPRTGIEATSVTTPMLRPPVDSSEEKTAILPPVPEP